MVGDARVYVYIYIYIYIYLFFCVAISAQAIQRESQLYLCEGFLDQVQHLFFSILELGLDVVW